MNVLPTMTHAHTNGSSPPLTWVLADPAPRGKKPRQEVKARSSIIATATARRSVPGLRTAGGDDAPALDSLQLGRDDRCGSGVAEAVEGRVCQDHQEVDAAPTCVCGLCGGGV